MLTGGSVGAGWDQLERGRSEGGPSGYTDEPYERIVCDEVDIDTIKPSEPEGV